MKNPVFIKEVDIELCKKYSGNPEKLEAILKNDSFQWSRVITDRDINEYGSFYKYRIEVKYKKRALTFEFSDSIANKKEGKSPRLYDILYCIKSEYYMAKDYPVLDDYATEFCEGMKISKIIESHTAIIKFAKDIGNVFTEEEIECFPS